MARDDANNFGTNISLSSRQAPWFWAQIGMANTTAPVEKQIKIDAFLANGEDFAKWNAAFGEIAQPLPGEIWIRIERSDDDARNAGIGDRAGGWSMTGEPRRGLARDIERAARLPDQPEAVVGHGHSDWVAEVLR